jgi:hypothetical protein
MLNIDVPISKTAFGKAANAFVPTYENLLNKLSILVNRKAWNEVV